MAQSAPELTLEDLGLSEDELRRAALVDFSVDREDKVPVGVQLEWKIRAMMTRGALSPGDRLPSVRELAEFAEINVNTARAVYSELEQAGLIASEQGRGTFVTGAAAELGDVDQAAAESMDRALAQQIDPRELAITLYAASSGVRPAQTDLDLPPLAPDEEGPGLRRELRRQIAHLERQIAGYAWEDRRNLDSDRRFGLPEAKVASAEELEQTRLDLIAKLAQLRADAHRKGEHQQAARAHIEELVRDPAGHRWEMITSAQTGDEGCKNWRVVPRFGPVGAVMGWWRVKVSSGCPLAGPLAAANQDE